MAIFGLSQINELLTKNHSISLNFKGLDETIADVRTVAEEDVDNLLRISRECNLWALYLRRMLGLLSFYQDLYQIKKDALDALVKEADIDVRNGTLHSLKIAKTCKIHDDDAVSILASAMAKYDIATEEVKLIRKFSAAILAQLKYMSYMSMVLSKRHLRALNQI